MIPPKVVLKGNKDKAEGLRAFSLSQLTILHKQMTFQGLKQDVRRISFEDGTLIEIKSNFGLDVVSISVPLITTEEVEAEGYEGYEGESEVSVLGGKIKLSAGPVKVVVCDPEIIPAMSWPDTNPETMERNFNKLVCIEGGVPPYKWEVTGQGYWFDEEYTLKLLEGVTANAPGYCSPSVGNIQEICESNGGTWISRCCVKLYADSTICGAAEITVIDLCEQVVYGKVLYDNQLEWFDTNPTEMYRGTKLLLFIVDGEAPYKWTVEGKGFWFDKEYTLTEITTGKKWIYLYAEASSIVPVDIWPFHAGACPPAAITVTDDCDSEVEREIGIIGIEALIWKEGNATVSACADSEVTVEWKGGVPPFKCELSGEKFSFVLGFFAQLTFMLYREATIHASDTSCGESSTLVTTDTCGSRIAKNIKVERPDVKISWDSESSDDTIDAGKTCTVAVLDGAPPYKWEVSPDDGFSFASEETEEPTNLLSAEADACGLATITVTDCCGESCTGKVRCTAGQWQGITGFACGNYSTGIDYYYYSSGLRLKLWRDAEARAWCDCPIGAGDCTPLDWKAYFGWGSGELQQGDCQEWVC